jgi:hypothetical protein
MKIKVLLVLLLSICIAKPLYAQDWLPSFLQDDLDTMHVVSYSNELTMRMLLMNRELTFRLRDRENRNARVSYSPNRQFSFGVGAIYANIGGTLSVQIARNQARRAERFGDTDFFDIQLNGYGPKVGADLNIQSYRGFYINNPTIVEPDWQSGQPFPQRPDLRVLNTGLNVYYIHNHSHFSYQAAFINTKQQIKSAGSFLVMISINGLTYEADTTLVTDPDSKGFTGYTDIRQGQFFAISAMPGYAYTRAYKNFYATAALNMGVGPQYQRYARAEGAFTNRLANTLRINGRLAGGYNGKKFIAGVSLVIDHSDARVENLVFDAIAHNVRGFIGYRF